MYCGVTVNTTDSGAQREIIEDGVDGYIVKSNDEKILTEKIILIYDNPLDAEEISVVAKANVTARFNIDKCVKKLFCIFKDLGEGLRI